MSNWAKIVAPAKIIATYLTRCNSDSYSLTRVTHFNLFTLELTQISCKFTALLKFGHIL